MTERFYIFGLVKLRGWENSNDEKVFLITQLFIRFPFPSGHGLVEARQRKWERGSFGVQRRRFSAFRPTGTHSSQCRPSSASTSAATWQPSQLAQPTVGSCQTGEREIGSFCLVFIIFPSSFLSFHLFFLDAFSHLYKRVCPSVRPSVGRSIGPSRTFLGATYAVYAALSVKNFV